MDHLSCGPQTKVKQPIPGLLIARSTQANSSIQDWIMCEVAELPAPAREASSASVLVKAFLPNQYSPTLTPNKIYDPNFHAPTNIDFCTL